MSKMQTRRRVRPKGWLLTAALVAAVMCLSTTAWSAVPTTVAIEGRLMTAQGGPVADGSYAVTFSLYPKQAAQQATWTETVAKMAVKGGVFQHALGSVKALNPKLLSSGQAWLALRIANEPELSRNMLHSAPFALRAAVADSVACTGCVSLSALKADGDLDLGGNALKSKLISAGSVVAQTVSSAAFSGDGSKLTGIKLPPSTCPKGQAAVGIEQDGKLKCAAGAGGGGTLEQISNNLLTTKFAQPVASKTVPKAIEDNNPIGTFDEITVPDIGPAKNLTVSVQLTNSDITGVELVLYDPQNTKYVLFKGGKGGKSLKETWPETLKPVSGDLSKWVGKNPKGKWRLRVIDAKFLNNGKDGELQAWSINLLASQSKQITSTGVFMAAGGLKHQVSAGPPFACTSDQVGWMYLDSKDKRLYYCDGDWRKLLIEPLCGNKVINPGEQCDDGNIKDGDGCTAKCQKNICGDGVLWTGKEECDDGNVKAGDECTPLCKFSNCLKDWKVNSPCNGKDYGGGCTPNQTGYHFKGVYTQGGVKWGCWWHTKNQAWNTSNQTNFYSLAKQFKLQTGSGGSKWCHAKSKNPCSAGACANSSSSYFSQNQVGAWGWCGGAPFSSGGFVCIKSGNVSACKP